MDVCAIIRTRLRRAGAPKRIKVGHGGTLDPMATGLLVVLVGKATRLCNEIMVGQKQYEARIDLSRTSTTDDAEGALTQVHVTHVPTPSEVESAATAFRGPIQQRPPDFSALKVSGKRAYDIAREGGRVELKPRPVEVHELVITGYQWPYLDLRITCGKGTYIRSIARDLGAALNAGGMLVALRRTTTGAFNIGHARTLDQLPQVLTQADLLPLPSATA